MYYDNELHFLQKMLGKCNLQTTIINLNDIISEKINNRLINVFENLIKGKTFYDFFPEIKPNTIFRISDIFLCRYIFFELPFFKEQKIFIIGPYLNYDISSREIFEQCEIMKISPKSYKQIEMFLSTVPVIKEENYIFAMINTLAEFLWNGSENYEFEDIAREELPNFMPNLFEPKQDDESVKSVMMEARYDYENELIKAVSQGNLQKAEQMMSNFSTNSFEKRVSDRLRNIKNYCIIMNTLLRKAAESGGVHPMYIDRVSSDFAKRIEGLISESQAYDFMLEILRTYCKLVKRHSIKSYSPLVQKAVLKIENSLTDDLSLNAIAKLNNVSPNYFSAVFKKETGKTLTEYVNSKRVSFAKYLLKNTNLQVQTVAQHCGVLDFHYFCRMFKKNTGLTPSQYRSKIIK